MIRSESPRIAVARLERFRFHCLPDREQRPGSRRPASPEAGGLFRPHLPCPFDGDAFVRERELARVRREGRVYHLTVNRFPITPYHFLGIRPEDASPEALPQVLQGSAEIEDIAACLRDVGPGFRGYFNSSGGADGSRSGSSVHHWHFQFLAYPGDATPLEVAAREAGVLPGVGASARSDRGVLTGSVPDWPARHLWFESVDDAALAAAVWEHLGPVHRRDAAYNLELCELPDGGLRAWLFPRRAAPDRTVEGVGRLSSNFGGMELSGDLVVPTRALFDWHVAHPEAADRLTAERLRETTWHPGSPDG